MSPKQGLAHYSHRSALRVGTCNTTKSVLFINVLYVRQTVTVLLSKNCLLLAAQLIFSVKYPVRQDYLVLIKVLLHARAPALRHVLLAVEKSKVSKDVMLAEQEHIRTERLDNVYLVLAAPTPLRYLLHVRILAWKVQEFYFQIVVTNVILVKWAIITMVLLVTVMLAWVHANQMI